MPNSATITREQLRSIVIATELGDKTGDSNHFSYAKLASSSSSFGQMQFSAPHSWQSEKAARHADAGFRMEYPVCCGVCFSH